MITDNSPFYFQVKDNRNIYLMNTLAKTTQEMHAHCKKKEAAPTRGTQQQRHFFTVIKKEAQKLGRLREMPEATPTV